MSNQSIHDTPEYKLASHEKQNWAFTHKDKYVSSVDAAQRMGMNLKDLKANVKLNTGEEMEIPLEAYLYSVQPDPKFKRKYAKVGNKEQTVYMVKGSSPGNKTAVYFSHKDFMDSPSVKKIISDIDAAHQAFKDQHQKMVKAELVKSHPAAAKKAAKELPELAKQTDAVQKVYDWFVKNGFNMGHVKQEHLKHFVSDLKKDGHVSSTFHVSARSDGYGHQTGTSGIIDFTNKVIGLQGWSSDD